MQTPIQLHKHNTAHELLEIITIYEHQNRLSPYLCEPPISPAVAHNARTLVQALSSESLHTVEEITSTLYGGICIYLRTPAHTLQIDITTHTFNYLITTPNDHHYFPEQPFTQEAFTRLEGHILAEN